MRKGWASSEEIETTRINILHVGWNSVGCRNNGDHPSLKKYVAGYRWNGRDIGQVDNVAFIPVRNYIN